MNAFRRAFRTVSGCTNAAAKVAVASIDPFPGNAHRDRQVRGTARRKRRAVSASAGLVQATLATAGIFDMSEIVSRTVERGSGLPNTARLG